MFPLNFCFFLISCLDKIIFCVVLLLSRFLKSGTIALPMPCEKNSLADFLLEPDSTSKIKETTF